MHTCQIDIRLFLTLLEKHHTWNMNANFNLILTILFSFYFQLPEAIEPTMSTSASIPTSIRDCTDNSKINQTTSSPNIKFKMPASVTLPDLKTPATTSPLENGSVHLPVECATLSADAQDLLQRLLEFQPDRRIRSIFALQRIPFFKGFKFDDAKKKKVYQSS